MIGLAFLFVAVAQFDPIPIAVELRLPIPTCIPTIVGVDGKALTYPPSHPLVLTSPTEDVRIVVASSCHEPRWICIRYYVECDDPCVWALGPGRTPGKSEVRVDDTLRFYSPESCWNGPKRVTCQLHWEPMAMGDLDGDCFASKSDLPMFASSPALNRLGVFADFQNEYVPDPEYRDWVGRTFGE